MSITTTIAHFRSLELFQLYDIMALREAVFMLEQKCPIADFDGLDKSSEHVWTEDHRNNDGILAVARILPPGVYYDNAVSFGRIAVKKSHRGQGYGKRIVDTLIRYIREEYPDFPIIFSAQLYLQKFYEASGFIAVGEVYEEAAIPHIKMQSGVNQE